jgi:hypothetical protein
MMRREKTRRVPHGQSSRALPLAAVCLVLLLPVLAHADDPLQGQWQGTLTLPGQETIPVLLKLDQASDGSWSGSIDPNRSGQPIALKGLAVSGSALSFRYQSEQMEKAAFFSGNYQSWDDAIKGVFVLAGTTMPIRFERVGVGPGGALSPAAAESSRVEVETRGHVRHQRHFGIEGRYGIWYPVYVLKMDERNINDITTSASGWGAGVHLYLLDGLALGGRWLNSGLAFDTNEKNLARFGFTGKEFIEFKGWEIFLRAYMGNMLLPDSKFDPYVTAIFGKVDWKLLVDGRGGSEVYQILDEPVEGTDYMAGAGLGVEYPISSRLMVLAEWIWRYIRTEDKTKWANVDQGWTNTHAWDVSLGLMIEF